MNLVDIFVGPTPFADMLRDELRDRGIRAVVHATGPFLGIIGDAARTPYSVVRISDLELEARPAQIRECLAFFEPLPDDSDSATAATGE
jgi:hypothetical protein